MKYVKSILICLSFLIIFLSTNVLAEYNVTEFSNTLLLSETRRLENGTPVCESEGTNLNLQVCELRDSQEKLLGYYAGQNIFSYELGNELKQTSNWFIAFNKTDIFGTKKYCNRNIADCGDNSIVFGVNFQYDDMALAGYSGVTCSLDNVYGNLKYDIGALINYYNSKLANGTSSIDEYYYLNLFINKYIAEQTFGKTNAYKNVYSGNIINEDFYRAIIKQNDNISFSTNNVSEFEKSGSIYRSKDININGLPSNTNFNIIMTDSNGKDYSNYAFFVYDGSSYKIKVCTKKSDDLCENITSDLPKDLYNISIKTSIDKTVPTSAFYKCNLTFPEYAQGTYTYNSTGYDSNGGTYAVPIQLQYNKPASKTAYAIPATIKNETLTKTVELKAVLNLKDTIINNDSSENSDQIEENIPTKDSTNIKGKNEVEVPNTLSVISMTFILLGVISVLSGGYLVYKNIKNKKLV